MKNKRKAQINLLADKGKIMASLDFDAEKSIFRKYYAENYKLLESAKDSFITLITSLVGNTTDIPISKIEGRVKDREESIKKFNRKVSA